MTNPYGEGARRRAPKVQTIRVTGPVTLYGPEIDIVDTPEFQRLGGIKQLGTSYVVFRGAVHTRFEHSLGALQEAQRIIDAVNRNVRNQRATGIRRGVRSIDERGTRLARLAALLHDLPHVPFGHTLEDEFRLLDRHDENSKRLQALLVRSAIGDILRDALDASELKDLMAVLDLADRPRHTSKDAFYADRLGQYAYVADIVANTVCADVLDYIVRDLSACGMPVALGTRFLDYFEITPGNLPIAAHRHRLALRLDKRGMPRPDVESEVLKLLTYRYELAERVFFHHAKNAASVMIGEAVALLGLHQWDENFHWLTDDVLLAVLKTPAIASALRLRVNATPECRAKAARLGALIARRKLYKLAYLGVSDDDVSLRAEDVYRRWGEDPDARRALQAELSARAGLDADRVLVHIPSPRMMTKLARVRVLLDEDTVTTFEEWEARHAARVQALNGAHARLWRIAVYMDPDDYVAEDGGRKRLVQSAARETFDLPSRYARSEVEEPYLAAVYDRIAPENGWTVGKRAQHIVRAAQLAAKTEGAMDLEATASVLRQAVEQDTPPADEGARSDGAQGTLTP